MMRRIKNEYRVEATAQYLSGVDVIQQDPLTRSFSTLKDALRFAETLTKRGRWLNVWVYKVEAKWEGGSIPVIGSIKELKGLLRG